MRIQTGQPVRGDDFYVRKNLIDQAWGMIDSGKHILIAAPRRVGKTSLMKFLMDHPKANYQFIYLITAAVNNENEFFRRIVNKTLETDYIKKSKRILTLLEKHKPTIKKVGPDGIEFGVSEGHNYKEMLMRMLKSADSETKKLVIMLDEFPETLDNILRDESPNEARTFLNSNRDLRQDTEVSEMVQFIYTGSIGLENIVSNLNAIKTINDLSRLKITPFSVEEAKDLIDKLLHNVPFGLSETSIDYILQQIEWLIPFYIQLTIEELKVIHREDEMEEITNSTIDKALSQMLEQRHHFEHWHTRLRGTLQGNEYNFIKDLLNLISENETIESNEIFNLAVKYKLENTFKDLVNALVYDGYINNNENNRIYRYNSPILRMWWRKNVAN